MNSRTMLQGMRDETDFKEVDPQQLASRFAARGFARAIPEAETTDLALLKQFGGKAVCIVDPSHNAKAAIIFRDAFDDADGLIRPVLPQEG